MPASPARFAAVLLLVAAAALAAVPRDPFTLDRDAERWVDDTFKQLTADEKIGQLLVPSFESNFLSTDSDTFDMLSRLVREYHVGGFHAIERETFLISVEGPALGCTAARAPIDNKTDVSTKRIACMVTKRLIAPR